MCALEGVGDELIAKFAREDRVAQRAVVGHGFVDDVPRAHVTAVAPYHLVDVALNRALEVLCRHRVCDPRRQLLVPNQRVAFDGLVSGLGGRHHAVGLREVPVLVVDGLQ